MKHPVNYTPAKRRFTENIAVLITIAILIGAGYEIYYFSYAKGFNQAASNATGNWMAQAVEHHCAGYDHDTGIWRWEPQAAPVIMDVPAITLQQMPVPAPDIHITPLRKPEVRK